MKSVSLIVVFILLLIGCKRKYIYSLGIGIIPIPKEITEDPSIRYFYSNGDSSHCSAFHSKKYSFNNGEFASKQFFRDMNTCNKFKESIYLYTYSLGYQMVNVYMLKPWRATESKVKYFRIVDNMFLPPINEYSWVDQEDLGAFIDSISNSQSKY